MLDACRASGMLALAILAILAVQAGVLTSEIDRELPADDADGWVSIALRVFGDW